MRKNKVKLYSSETVLEDFYEAISQNNPNKAQRLHIPKSDVFKPSMLKLETSTP